MQARVLESQAQKRAVPGGEIGRLPQKRALLHPTWPSAGVPGAAVLRIADQGMAQMGEMDADLVGAPGFQTAFDQGWQTAAPSGPNFSITSIAGARQLAAAAQHRHALAVEGTAADLAFDHAGGNRAGRPTPPRDRHARWYDWRIAWPGLSWRVRSWRQPEGPMCPCPGGARCRGAPRRRCQHQSSPQWAIRALTSVPSGLPAAGCTTSPAGLSMTIRSLSS